MSNRLQSDVDQIKLQTRLIDNEVKVSSPSQRCIAAYAYSQTRLLDDAPRKLETHARAKSNEGKDCRKRTKDQAEQGVAVFGRKRRRGERLRERHRSSQLTRRGTALGCRWRG